MIKTIIIYFVFVPQIASNSNMSFLGQNLLTFIAFQSIEISTQNAFYGNTNSSKKIIIRLILERKLE